MASSSSQVRIPVDQQAKVLPELQKTDNGIIYENRDGTLTRKSLRRIVGPGSEDGGLPLGAPLLSPSNQWLDDETINIYMGLLVEEANTRNGWQYVKDGAAPRLVNLGSFFYTSLSNKSIGPTKMTRSGGLRRRNINGQKILDPDHIFIPRHENGNHWTLIVISPKLKMIGYLDSYNRAVANKLHPVIELLRFEAREKFVEDEWAVYTLGKNLQQSNITECGPFILNFATNIINGFNLRSVELGDLLNKRICVAYELFNYRITPETLRTSHGPFPPEKETDYNPSNGKPLRDFAPPRTQAGTVNNPVLLGPTPVKATPAPKNQPKYPQKPPPRQINVQPIVYPFESETSKRGLVKWIRANLDISFDGYVKKQREAAYNVDQFKNWMKGRYRAHLNKQVPGSAGPSYVPPPYQPPPGSYSGPSKINSLVPGSSRSSRVLTPSPSPEPSTDSSTSNNTTARSSGPSGIPQSSPTPAPAPTPAPTPAPNSSKSPSAIKRPRDEDSLPDTKRITTQKALLGSNKYTPIIISDSDDDDEQVIEPTSANKERDEEVKHSGEHGEAKDEEAKNTGIKKISSKSSSSSLSSEYFAAEDGVLDDDGF